MNAAFRSLKRQAAATHVVSSHCQPAEKWGNSGVVTVIWDWFPFLLHNFLSTPWEETGDLGGLERSRRTALEEKEQSCCFFYFLNSVHCLCEGRR